MTIRLFPSRAGHLCARCATLALAALVSLPLGAQTGASAQLANRQDSTPLPLPPPVEISSTSPNLATPAAPDSYRIGDTDLLSIFVAQMPELTRQVRVSGNGTVNLPYVRQPLAAADKTAPQLQQSIAAELVREGLARDPQVQVVVVQVESKPIVVAGAVNTPLTLQAARPLRLIEVLSRAGGLSEAAGASVVLTEGPTTTVIDLDPLLHSASGALNPLLSGGETVTVLPAKYVYAVGAFQKPGAFALRLGQPIGVIEAIALAQGLKASPDKSKAEIIHAQAGAPPQVQLVDVDKILKHKVPNPALQPGDILYVPENGKRALMITGLQDAAEIITLGTAYRF